MLSTPPFTGHSVSLGPETAHGRVPHNATATTNENATYAFVLLEAIQVLRVVSQRHAGELEGARPRDLVVVDHPLKRQDERLSRGVRRDPSGFFPGSLVRVRRRIGAEQDLLGPRGQPDAQERGLAPRL